MEELFKSSVRSMKLVEFLKWAKDSFTHQGANPEPKYGILALPAIQRDAAWKADQVANLWDSVLRGLPIGAFMLQQRASDSQGRIAASGARIKSLPQQGWDLLDGQQRLRSLLLGTRGPQFENDQNDLRCVWIDLREVGAFKLQMTSSSQPFGYDEKGNRLTPNQRSKARERYEPTNAEIKLGDRFVYTHALFENFIAQSHNFSLHTGTDNRRMPPERHPAGWPPLPADVELMEISEQSPYAILPLHILLEKWLNEPKTQRMVSVQHLVGEDKTDIVVKMLDMFEEAEIGLIDTSSINREENSKTRAVNLHRLYDRIGAGGTPLSLEDRLFSLYKSFRADFHNLVLDIVKKNGIVMTPSKIAVSAIRIANANVHATENRRSNEGNDAPDVINFIAEIEKEHSSMLLKELEEIFPKDNAENGLFYSAFNEIFSALKYHPFENPNGLPMVMIWRLPIQLIQTLLFWKIRMHSKFDRDDNDILRFSIGWLLTIGNNDKAVRRCFELIRENNSNSLQHLFNNLQNDSSVSLLLISPSEMNSILISTPEVNVWKSTSDRIAKMENIEEINQKLGDKQWRFGNFVNNWWNGAALYLPWLQRNYLAIAFPGYDPTADHEDDTPYDIDHIIPAKFWGDYWRAEDFPGINDLATEQRKRIMWVRHDLGNSIGNKWLVDLSSNRGWQAKPFPEKIDEIKDKSTNRSDYQLLLSDGFRCDDETYALWNRASMGGKWTSDCMSAFQHAVEERAAWLYCRLYVELGFEKWSEQASMGLERKL